MRVLLLRPGSPNERFCLGPFFRVEPLGLEYIASALLRQGHEVKLLDLRFLRSFAREFGRFRPQVVGISSTHTLDTDAALDAARKAKQLDSSCLTVIGGHAAAAYPEPFKQAFVDAICACDGETQLPPLLALWERGQRPEAFPGFWIRQSLGPSAEAFRLPGEVERYPLDQVPAPARSLVAPYQKRYRCVQKMPLWAVETARGCPYRCSFCSIWKLHQRSYRMRSIESVCEDMAAAGPNVFVIDDLFFHPADRSLELARELRRRGVRKEWILVQSRLDTVAAHGELLREWRMLADSFDIFFGFEAPRQEQLQRLSKDMSIDSLQAGVGVARAEGYGVTGNFVVDPDWDESDFQAMWDVVDRHRLGRAGYTILTPLPGTAYFEQCRPRLREWNWSHYDMHHLPWEPRLGRRRFFEMFVECWRRSVLNPSQSRGHRLEWIRGLSFRQLLLFAGAMVRTRRLLNVDAYLSETFPLQIPAGVGYGPKIASQD